ncbi:unnamed protein product [Rotaria sordida]|uniref:Uncharacterized protein n=1 Tax=Rotaria sordida TaxID=392033 RepID=A0A818KGA6_9BILA|nr:unnamed protein product [Rotaria sordida]CAF0892445.1 unnamed protein product [Rotaria sordida]CAF0901302.1 unnamed protein product [Rotaria sordida]CAF0931726.1 unnamed protein product [Rotaria sordida]CAF1023570.1 unnamed protein product [Rotaria sordida]
MNSIEKNINHDHIYSLNFEREKDCNQMKNSSNKNDNSSYNRRRIIRKKCDIQTDEDREDYNRRRMLNNTSCRISRMSRRSKLDSMIEKCTEYEDLNRKLIFQKLIIIQVINQLKEHLRTLVPNNMK